MAVGLNSTAANDLLTSLTGTYDYVQLHTGDPGANGTSAVASGLARKQVTTWATPSGGATSNTSVLTWTVVPSSTDYTHFTVWDTLTTGNFGFSGTITANPVTAGDTFSIAANDLDVSLPVAS